MSKQIIRNERAVKQQGKNNESAGKSNNNISINN